MMKHSYQSAFSFTFRDDKSEHYTVPDKTSNNLFSALMELEVADSIIDIMQKSQNDPRKRLFVSLRYAQTLLSDLPGLSSEDKAKLCEAQQLITDCESAEDILSSDENYWEFLARAAYCLTDIMQNVFSSNEEVQKVFDRALFEHYIFWCNPIFQRIWNEIG